MTQHNERVEEIVAEAKSRGVLAGDPFQSRENWLRTTLQTYTAECEARGREEGLADAEVKAVKDWLNSLSASKPLTPPTV